MATARGDMTVRVVPLNSREAADARVGGSVAERMALVARLSETQWALTRRPLPVYTRATMAVVAVPLCEQADRDEAPVG